MDSWTLNHRTSQLNMMVDVKEIAYVLVGLLNGANTFTTKTWKIHLTNDVVLNDVLCHAPTQSQAYGNCRDILKLVNEQIHISKILIIY